MTYYKPAFTDLTKESVPTAYFEESLDRLVISVQIDRSLNSKESGSIDSNSEYFFKLLLICASSDFIIRKIRRLVDKNCQKDFSNNVSK